MEMKANPAIQAFRRERDYDHSPQWFLDYATVAAGQGYGYEAKALRQMAVCAKIRRAAGWLLVAVSAGVIIWLVLQ